MFSKHRCCAFPKYVEIIVTNLKNANVSQVCIDGKILSKTTILLGTLFFNWVTHVPLEMFAYLIKNILNVVKNIKVRGQFQ